MKRKNEKLIFIVVYLAYTSIYLARVNLSIAGPEMINVGMVEKAQIGFLGSVFSCIYSIGRLINGGISDTTPPWKMISSGLFLAAICNIGISFFPPYMGIFFMWTVNAYAQSMLWSSVLCVVASIYSGEKAKQKASVMVTSVAAGNVLGIVLNTWFITQFGLRFAFLIPGLITLVLGAAVIFLTKDIQNETETGERKTLKTVFSAFQSGELRKMCIPAVFHGVTKENISLWMAVYIVDIYEVNLTQSAYYILLIPLIGFAARTIYPIFLRLFSNRENKVSFYFFGICALFSLILCLGKTHILLAVISLGIIYAGASVINTSFLSIYPLRYAKSGKSASVSGIMDFATYLGAGVSSALYGVVIKNFGYFPMFVSWIVISAVSMAILSRVKS